MLSVIALFVEYEIFEVLISFPFFLSFFFFFFFFGILGEGCGVVQSKRIVAYDILFLRVCNTIYSC